MKTSDAFWMFLPRGLEKLFEMVRFERTEQAYDIWLDEKKERSEEDRRNPNIVARDYTDYIVIQDYPLRGRPVYLHMRPTNASAEAFNSKVKIFRTQMKGVRDRNFFIFRLVKLYA